MLYFAPSAAICRVSAMTTTLCGCVRKIAKIGEIQHTGRGPRIDDATTACFHQRESMMARPVDQIEFITNGELPFVPPHLFNRRKQASPSVVVNNIHLSAVLDPPVSLYLSTLAQVYHPNIESLPAG